MTFRTLLPASLLFSTLAACTDAPADGPADDPSTDPGEDTGSAPGSDPATRYATLGAHAVGFTVLRDTGADLEVKAWYPADAVGDEEITYSVPLKLPGFGGKEMPFLGHAARDATPTGARGSRPLVVLSHGFAMNPEWYHPLAEHLASHGYVVLGPEHAESDWAADVIDATLVRPFEVAATIDLAETGVLEGVVDTARVAVVGHSYGGYTALASGGARIDTDELTERCVDVEDDFTAAYFCTPFLEGADELASGSGLDEVPEGLWPAEGDPRVDALVPMAGDAYLFGDEGLAEVTVPTLLMGGTADTGTPWDWGTGRAFEHLGSESLVLAALEGGEHMLPVTTCDAMPWTSALPVEYQDYFCEDPAWNKEEALVLINQLTTAFLLHYLTGSEAAGEALSPEVYSEVSGLALEVAG